MVIKTKIEWCDYVCNPVRGVCKHNCPYCYAIRMYRRFKWDPEVRFVHSAFDGIEKIKAGSKVFVGSTHDIFGDWIPDEWINSIILEIGRHSDITFIFLTKNPKRYKNFMFHKNIWLGYSTTGCLFHKWEEMHSGNIKFVSLEPMQHIINASLEGYAQRIDFQLLIIGQETGNRKSRIFPKKEWIDEAIRFARRADIKLFLKDNLQYPLIIQEFPLIHH